ncbi:DddA-like double-stranded DNA deaminase toxin [Actinokineospora diospyrosa]|uniref:DddA-like double-stranded DNA deaminase toxin n=1 Tax=Actinokineospora diospyrosa TaxID=103728 RepID=UPI0020A3021E|nr:DddA-like double-stranded DNA deaminase toxin [Actinokineospora diospyrosa]
MTEGLAELRSKVEQVVTWLDEARRTVHQVLWGTNTFTAPALSVLAANDCLQRLLAAISEAEALLAAVLARADPPTPVTSPRPGVANRHGDRYPAAAMPYQDVLPPRVRQGRRNAPIVAILEIDGQSFGELSATVQDDWTVESRARIRALGLARRADRVANHVEMKAVVVMVRTRGRQARVIINHAPCGSEPGAWIGCHSVLPDFIPEGSSLTVLGTDARGEPFFRTYKGKATR